MNYLITAAGKGSRFLKLGIKPPKPLIKVLGNELLIWSLNSFDFKKGDCLYIVCLKRHKVKERLKNKIFFMFPDIQISWLELDDILDGQLMTSLKAINYFSIKGPITIHNCDTFYKFDREEVETYLKHKDVFGIIPCFEANGKHWSFVKTSNNQSDLVVEVKEKEKISNNCSVGTYIFSSVEKFLELSNKYLNSIDIGKFKEIYIAPLYQYALEKNNKVIMLNARNVKVYGTLEELLLSFSVTTQELIGENGLNGNQIKTLVIDIDNTICKKNDDTCYSKAIPIRSVCEAIRKANSQGIYIVLFTSRNMRTFKGSVGLINKFTSPILLRWLSDNDIPYDEIYFGKPWGNSISYIDDKSLKIEDFIQNFKS